MKAMILAAGLGTRLRPWTLTHPKALVPVGNRPMLARVINRLRAEGFDELVVNVHHFGQQIIDFLSCPEFASVGISDERARLLNTGGGVLKAVGHSSEPVLVHNVDILSTASLAGLWKANLENKDAAATLLVSDRPSSRKLAFDVSGALTGWVNLTTGQTKGIVDADSQLLAFSGIYVTNPAMLRAMATFAEMETECKEDSKYSADDCDSHKHSPTDNKEFALMDFLLSHTGALRFQAYVDRSLRLLDIGKPEALAHADEWLAANNL